MNEEKLMVKRCSLAERFDSIRRARGKTDRMVVVDGERPIIDCNIGSSVPPHFSQHSLHSWGECILLYIVIHLYHCMYTYVHVDYILYACMCVYIEVFPSFSLERRIILHV